MNQLKILFLAADPFSIPPDGTSPRLRLDEEFRQTRKKVRSALYGYVLDFDWRPAARTKDLQHALEETHPRVVHFSGHGSDRGIVLVGADGRTPRRIGADLLRELFQMDCRSIRLVVLTACHSLSHAEALKEVVGCAIGTRRQISDDAAITFNAKFYSAIASGRSVKQAFERARVAVELDYPDERGNLELLHRANVDPAKLVLVSRLRRVALFGIGSAVAIPAVAAAILIMHDPPPPWNGVRLGDCTSTRIAPAPAPSPLLAGSVSDTNTPPVGATVLEQARDRCRVGNYDDAFVLLNEASKAGHVEATGLLGVAYLSGEGTKREPQRAIDLLRKAAYGRDLRAMKVLALAYQNGDEDEWGVDRNLYRAKYWFETAAKETDDAEAMHSLARLHLEEKADSLALFWFRGAADAGERDAMVDLGLMYDQGRGTPRDPAEAVRLYGRAAQAGSTRGMVALGQSYANGVGVARDYRQARAWNLRAACQGSADAMYNLGVLYRNGLGVPADQRKAVRWLRRGARAGSAEAATMLVELDAGARPVVEKALAWVGLGEARSPSGCDAPHAAAGSTGAAGQLAAR